MTDAGILTFVIFTAILSQPAISTDPDSPADVCKGLNIFKLEDYSVASSEERELSVCNDTENKNWAYNISHYFKQQKERVNKKNSTERESGRQHLRVGTKQLLRMLMYSLNELPNCSNWTGIDRTKLSTDIINAFSTFPPPATLPNYFKLACQLNEKWKIEKEKQQEQAMYIIDCILRSGGLLDFIICDKI